MNRPSASPRTQHQGTVAPRIVGVILDNLPSINDGTDLLRADHPVRTRHLANGVREEQDPLRSTLPDKFQELPRLIHVARLCAENALCNFLRRWGSSPLCESRT